MKSTIKTMAMMLFASFILFSCNQKDEVMEGIYAPSGDMVSQSMEDFNETIAEAIHVEKENVAIKSVSFLDVSEGYAAEVEIATPTANTTVYYISNKLRRKMEFDSSIEVVDNASAAREPSISDGVTAYCSCSNNSFPSSGCRVSVTEHPDGSVTGTCYTQGCSFGCVFHSE